MQNWQEIAVTVTLPGKGVGVVADERQAVADIKYRKEEKLHFPKVALLSFMVYI